MSNAANAKVAPGVAGGGPHREPRIVALTYFSLGAEVESASRGYLLDYYGFLGDAAHGIADGALRSAEQVQAAVAAYADAGDELVLDPTVASLDQVDRLADIVL